MNNETDKCCSCRKGGQTLYAFSCYHKNCVQCLIQNFSFSNLAGMTIDHVLITCQACSKGQMKIDIESMINLFNSSMPSSANVKQAPSKQQLCSIHSIAVEAFCQTCCFWLCSECKKQYHAKVYPDHLLISKEDKALTSSLTCSTHLNVSIDTFCLKCQAGICKRCLSKGEAHFNHRSLPIEDKPLERPHSVLKNYQSYSEFLAFIEDNEKFFFERLENDFIVQKQKVEDFVNSITSMFNAYSKQMKQFHNDMKNVYQLIKLSYGNYFNSLENGAASRKTFPFPKYITDIALIAQKAVDVDGLNSVLISSNKDKQNKPFDYKLVWNNNEVVQRQRKECHPEGVTHIIELKRSKGFATCSIDASIKIWEYAVDDDQGRLDEYQVQDSVNVQLNPPSFQLIQTLNGHKSSIWALIECKDGVLISGSSDKTIKLWSVSSGINFDSLIGHKDTIYSLAELKSHLIASGSEDKTIRVWNRKDKQCVCILSGHTGKITSLTVLLDDCLVSGSDDNSLMLWNVNEGVCSGKLIGHGCTVWCSLAFDDGITLASGSSDNFIKLWDLNQLKCISTFEGHDNTISQILLLKNGYLASVSWDASVKFWDLNTRLCVFSIKVHSDIIWDIIETVDGKIITASNDKSIIIWESK